MSEHTMLYRFFDENDTLLYVGISSRGPQRWKEHSVNRPWWHKVAKSTIEHYETRGTALQAEREAILAERPLYNTAHNRRVQSTQCVNTESLRGNSREWREQILSEIKKLSLERYDIEPLEWRSKVVYSPHKIVEQQHERNRPFLGVDLLKHRTGNWVHISLDYPSRQRYEGVEAGEIFDRWMTLWGYVTSQVSYFFHPTFAGSQYLYITCPVAFADPFLKAFLAAEQGKRHWMLDPIDRALNDTSEELRHLYELDDASTFREARNAALSVYVRAHRILADAIGNRHLA